MIELFLLAGENGRKAARLEDISFRLRAEDIDLLAQMEDLRR